MQDTKATRTSKIFRLCFAAAPKGFNKLGLGLFVNFREGTMLTA